MRSELATAQIQDIVCKYPTIKQQIVILMLQFMYRLNKQDLMC